MIPLLRRNLNRRDSHSTHGNSPSPLPFSSSSPPVLFVFTSPCHPQLPLTSNCLVPSPIFARSSNFPLLFSILGFYFTGNKFLCALFRCLCGDCFIFSWGCLQRSIFNVCEWESSTVYCCVLFNVYLYADVYDSRNDFHVVVSWGSFWSC